MPALARNTLCWQCPIKLKKTTPSSVPFPCCNATGKEYRRTISSSSAASFALPVSGRFVCVVPALSLDELIARLARSPIGTASSRYGSISESTRVLGETGVSSEPDDARRVCPWFYDPCSSSDSSGCPALLPARVSSWNGFEAEPAGRGEHTEDWGGSSHAITFCRCWSEVDVAVRCAWIEA